MTPMERLAQLAEIVIALADRDDGDYETLVERSRDLATEAKKLAKRGTITVYPGGGIFSVRAMDELWRQAHADAGDVVFRGWDSPTAPEPWATLARSVQR